VIFLKGFDMFVVAVVLINFKSF